MNRVRRSLFLLLVVTIFGAPAQAHNEVNGGKLYISYCSACHEEKGKGDGIAARGLSVKPADHTNGAIMNRLSDKYLIEVISKGGGGVGKSAFMPAWGSALNKKQIQDLVAFIRAIAKPPNRADAGANM